MSRRQTVDVAYLLAKVNFLNRKSILDPKIRDGWTTLLECVLHQTGNYHGFQYLSAKDVPTGHKPGIIFDESPQAAHQYPDPSRKAYYVRPELVPAYNKCLAEEELHFG